MSDTFEGLEGRWADPGYLGAARFPLDTEEECRAAWCDLDGAENVYSRGQLEKVRKRIRAALKRYGVNVNMSDASLTEAMRS